MDKSSFLTVRINGDDIPILCSLSVLEKIQEKYGSIEEYAKKICKTKENENGERVFADALPDVAAIYYTLPLMIDEGVTVYNEEHKIKMDSLKPEYIYRHYETPLRLIGWTLYQELMRSIHAPKRQPLTETNRK